MTYIGLPIVTDANRLATDILDRMMTNQPGWVPREGNLEVWQVEAIANALAEVLGVASRIDRGIFRYFGQSLIGLQSVDGTPATVPSTWVAVDSAGYTIRAGTTVAFRTSAGVLVPFVVAADVVIPSGSTTTGAGAVTLTAVTPGVGGNGYSAGVMTLVDALVFITSVTSTAVSSGGTDPETDDEYLDRLVAELALMAPRPIKARDFAAYARQVAGVARATALDNYKPSDDSFGNEKMVTVAMIDAAGQNVSGGVKTAAAALFAAAREINFVVNIIDPTRTTVDVAYVAVALPGYSPTTLRATINAAVTAYLSPANWGSHPTDPNEWTQYGTVRYLSVGNVIDSVPGVDYLTSLLLNGAAANVTLAGRISLPTPGTIDGTVS